MESKGSRKKKVYSLNGRAIKRAGVKGRAIKEKRFFLGTFFSNVPKFQRPLSSRGFLQLLFIYIRFIFF